MNCTRASDKLSAYLDRELPEPEAASVRQHLAACDRCAREYAELKSLQSPLHRLYVPPTPHDFARRVRAAAERSTTARHCLTVLGTWPLRVAAVLVAVAGLAVGLNLGDATYRATPTWTDTTYDETTVESLSAVPPGSLAEAYLAFMGDEEGGPGG